MSCQGAQEPCTRSTIENKNKIGDTNENEVIATGFCKRQRCQRQRRRRQQLHYDDDDARSMTTKTTATAITDKEKDENGQCRQSEECSLAGTPFKPRYRHFDGDTKSEYNKKMCFNGIRHAFSYPIIVLTHTHKRRHERQRQEK